MEINLNTQTPLPPPFSFSREVCSSCLTNVPKRRLTHKLLKDIQSVRQKYLDQTPAKVPSQESDIKDTTCAICLENIEPLVEDQETQLTVLECLHGFHKSCIEQWFSRHSTCPLDQKQMSNGLYVLDSNVQVRGSQVICQNTQEEFEKALSDEEKELMDQLALLEL